MRIKIINGKEYIPTKLVRLNDVVYQEYCSIDYMRPEIIYVTKSSGKVVNDWGTYYNLREKYAIDIRMLHGTFVLDNDGMEDDVIIEVDYEATEIEEIYERDVQEFTERAAQELGHICKARGIDDPYEWFEEKFRAGGPYIIDSRLEEGHSATCDVATGKIKFSSLGKAKNRFTRAHEMAHRLCLGANRAGLLVFFSHKMQDVDTGEVHDIYSENGRALSEGMTNLLAEVLSCLPYDKTYMKETKQAREIVKMVGKNKAFESTIFDPDILVHEFEARTGSRSWYMKFVKSMDEYYRLDRKMDCIRRGEIVNEEETHDKVGLAIFAEFSKAQDMLKEVQSMQQSKGQDK